MNTTGFPEFNLGPQTVGQSSFRDCAIPTTFHRSHQGMPNEFREIRLSDRHSDSTMARSEGLIWKPLISLFLRLFSFNVVFSFE